MGGFINCILTLCSVLSLTNAGNLTVTEEAWLDIEVMNFFGPGKDLSGRIIIALFGEAVPMTVLNFASIAKGTVQGEDFLHYKDNTIHRIIPDFVIQMGDITMQNGAGGRSIFGHLFEDENYFISHISKGIVSMSNTGPDTNNSQFFILNVPARWLDGKHVAFGKVLKGYDLLRHMNNIPVKPKTNYPKLKSRIVNSGLNNIPNRYDLTDEQFRSEKDIKV